MNPISRADWGGGLLTATVLLGWAMSLIGLLFLLLAFAAAGKNILRRGLTAARESESSVGGFTEALKYLAQVLRELGQLPLWIACLLAGLVLIFLGQRLVNGQSLFGP